MYLAIDHVIGLGLYFHFSPLKLHFSGDEQKNKALPVATCNTYTRCLSHLGPTVVDKDVLTFTLSILIPLRCRKTKTPDQIRLSVPHDALRFFFQIRFHDLNGMLETSACKVFLITLSGRSPISLGSPCCGSDSGYPGLSSPRCRWKFVESMTVLPPSQFRSSSGQIASPEIGNSVQCSRSQELRQRMSLTVTATMSA